MIGDCGSNGREKRLEDIVKEAYTKVPFYKKIALNEKIDSSSVDFSELPIVCKRDFLESDYVNVNIELINKLSEVISIMTSGTLGEPFEVKWDIVDEKKSILQLWIHRKRYYDISPADKLCYFFPAYIEGIETLNGKNYLAFSRKCIYDGSIDKIYRQLLEYNPRWMIIQPSMALALCEQAENTGRLPNELVYIECTGEELTDIIRERIKRTFKCVVANQYGCKEVGSIAYECPYGNMHVMENSVYLEVDSETSNLYVTSLDNHVMPFIRYSVGDKGILCSEKECKCGNKAPVIKLISGRAEEYVYLKNGKKLHLYALTQIINNINYLLKNCIIQYCVTQNDYLDFTFDVVIEGICEEEIIKQMLKEKMQQRIGKEVNVKINIYRHFMENVNKEKHSTFISKMKRGDEGM